MTAVEAALEAALALANVGFAVFPCNDQKKPTCSHGFKDAVCDTDAVRKVWQAHPGVLVGLATGEVNSVAVLDLDLTRHREAVGWLQRHGPKLPQTFAYQTRGGGQHRWFRHRPGLGCSQGKGKTRGVDVRADGGYVVYWPAHGGQVLHDESLADWPAFLDDALAIRPGKTTAAPPAPDSLKAIGKDALAAIVRQIPNGSAFDDRGKWVALAHALAAAFQDDPALAAELWFEHAAKREQAPGEAERVWNTLAGPHLLGADWIVATAKAAGIDTREYEKAAAAASFAAAGPIPADPAAPPVTLPNFYTLDGRGLFFRPPQKGTDEPAAPQWLAAPFEVLAETSDAYSGAWGLLLRWQDRNGRPHQWAMPRRLVHADGNAIAAELEESGLSCATGKTAHERLKAFFGSVTVARRVHCVERCGWHQTETGEVFVLPNGETFGTTDSNVALQTDRAVVGTTFDARGTLGEWQQAVARYAEGNDRLALFLSAAFAGPLLDVTGEPSGGFHLVGKSQSGKTAMVRAAASVWGEGSARGQVRTWRATANGLEGVAAECSDGLLILDELGQADPREVSETVYLLANESGKARADRGGAARRRRTWRVMLLSTGEMTLSTKLAEAGRHARAGQHVRLADVPADAGAGMGVFQALHDASTAAALADRLRDATRTVFGTAARDYLTALARDRASGTGELPRTVLSWRAEFERRHLPPGADGQVRSVAARFGLVAAAGELARSYGVLPWSEGEALRAAGACFSAWLNERGGAGATEDMQAIEQVRAFIAAHGASRFELVVHPETAAFAGERIVNRAGFKRRCQPESTGEGSVPPWEYLILPSVWSTEVCRGLNAKQAADALQAHGLLRGATGRHRAALVNVPGHGKTRVYCISGAILAETEQDAAETQQDGETQQDAAGTAVA